VYTLNGSSLFEIKNVVLRVKVTDIKSTKGKMMDNKTYDAFNYEKNPFITFKLTTQKVNEAESTIDVKGDLTMAGVTKTIDMTISYKLLAGGDLQIVGSQILSMTDFGMEPPTAMMGTIKVGKEVTVKFELTLTNNNKI
jgi:polyisoprenoid-binding protein YceI